MARATATPKVSAGTSQICRYHQGLFQIHQEGIAERVGPGLLAALASFIIYLSNQ